MSIHSQNEQVILEFGLKKPAFRIVVNTPTTHGSVGLSTGLDPAMTLGCGGYGGNITSDNISPRHLLNIKRLAYEVAPVVSRWDRSGAGRIERDGRMEREASAERRLPSPPPRPPAPAGISAEALSRRIDQFLASRGIGEVRVNSQSKQSDLEVRVNSQTSSQTADKPDQKPMDFVCEEDVRLAIQAGRKLVISERAIVTPAARDLAEQHRVLTVAPWRG
jgi:hypothetical protein